VQDLSLSRQICFAAGEAGGIVSLCTPPDSDGARPLRRLKPSTPG
jgi:hypothetical protein